jgi:hypothetical protein
MSLKYDRDAEWMDVVVTILWMHVLRLRIIIWCIVYAWFTLLSARFLTMIEVKEVFIVTSISWKWISWEVIQTVIEGMKFAWRFLLCWNFELHGNFIATSWFHGFPRIWNRLKKLDEELKIFCISFSNFFSVQQKPIQPNELFEPLEVEVVWIDRTSTLPRWKSSTLVTTLLVLSSKTCFQFCMVFYWKFGVFLVGQAIEWFFKVTGTCSFSF